MERLNKELERARSQQHALWIEASAYELLAADAKGRIWLAAHERPEELIRYHDAKHDFRFYCAR